MTSTSRDLVKSAAEQLFMDSIDEVRATPAWRMAAEMIRQPILLHLVHPLQRLPVERELAARMGVSRVVVSQALRILEAEGLVQTRPGRYGGTVIQPFQEGDPSQFLEKHTELSEILDLRIANEPLGVAMAVKRGLANMPEFELLCQTIDPLRNAYDKLKDLFNLQIDSDQATSDRRAAAQEYHRNDTVFHLTIAKASGSQRLRRLVRDLRIAFFAPIDLQHWYWQNPRSSAEQNSPAEHRAILDAIKTGNADEAAKEMQNHIIQTKVSFLGFLELQEERMERWPGAGVTGRVPS